MLTSIPVRPLARLLAGALTAVAVLVTICAYAVATGAGTDPQQRADPFAASPATVTHTAMAGGPAATAGGPVRLTDSPAQVARQGEPPCVECAERDHSNCGGPVGHAVLGGSSYTSQPLAAADRGPYAVAPRAPETRAPRLTDAAPRAPDLHLLQLLRV
ncbi:hypothetical protein ACX6XY_09475 [Streptomyces sp. O3]